MERVICQIGIILNCNLNLHLWLILMWHNQSLLSQNLSYTIAANSTKTPQLKTYGALWCWCCLFNKMLNYILNLKQCGYCAIFSLWHLAVYNLVDSIFILSLGLDCFVIPLARCWDSKIIFMLLKFYFVWIHR